VVFTSTNLVYPSGLGRPATEDDPAEPDAAWGPYPRSKVLAERDLLGREGIDVTVVRLAFVYGEGDPHLRESLRWAARWPGHQHLHMVHHADAAGALFRALDARGRSGRIYNAADDAPITAVELHQLAGVEGPAEAPADPVPDPWHGIVSTRRIRTELGRRLQFPSAWAAWEAGAL
jgi:nucleoside-diphosphate-sugar epimerase